MGHTPLNVIQMIWVNLIMDILAAIALGTETYKKDSEVSVANKSNRISRKDKIMLPFMWRNIFVQSLYQITVMCILMYVGMFMFFDQSFNLVSTPLRYTSGDKKGEPTDRLTLNTIMFHSFVLMTLFNQINCRVIEVDEINVFKTLFNNKYFWVIFLFEMGLQHLMLMAGNTKLGGSIFGTAPLTIE